MSTKTKKLSQHRGPISLAMIAEGMNSARVNARRLFEDASTLHEAGRTPSALALAILSIEESGKISILRQMVLCETEEEWRKAWKDYRSHTSKNTAWILGELAARSERSRKIHASYTAFRERTAAWSQISIKAVLEAREG